MTDIPRSRDSHSTESVERRRTLLVEDDERTRLRLGRDLETSAAVDLIASRGTYEAGRRALDDHRPEIFVTDLGLPDGSGIDLIRHARALRPSCLIMVITVFGDENSVIRAIEAGADSYLLKDATGREISSAIDDLIAGGSPMSAPIARHLLRRFQNRPTQDAPAPAVESDRPALTAREFEILNLVAKGFSFREIAEMLEVSPHTIRTHVRRTYGKLEVSTKSAAVYEAVHLGLIELN